MNAYQKKKLKRSLLAAGALLFVAAGAYLQHEKSNEPAGNQETVSVLVETSEISTAVESAEASKTAGQTAAEILYVYITGAVQSPGVYECPAGTRLFEIIEMAGGLNGTADLRRINQAETVSDGQEIIVPEVGETTFEYEEEGTSSGGDSRININTAGVSELTALSGIGEAKASAIVSYREEHGAFQDITEIMNVSGIGEGLFAKIKDSIKI